MKIWRTLGISLAVAFALLLAVQGSALALVQQLTLAELTAVADSILVGEVTDIACYEEGRGNIYTLVTLCVEQTVKGGDEREVVIRVPGGEVDGLGLRVSDTPSFKVGEKAVVFLEKDRSNSALCGWHQGKFAIQDNKVVRTSQPLMNFVADVCYLIEAQRATLEMSVKPAVMKPESPLPRNHDYLYEMALINDSSFSGSGFSGSPPHIDSISPSLASAGTSSQVTIYGSNFGAIQEGSSRVMFFYSSGQPGIEAPIVYWSDSEIECRVPVGAGSGPVIVTTSEGDSSGYNFYVTFGYSGRKWFGANPVVDLLVNENCLDCTGELAAIQASFQTWNSVPNADFNFTYGGTTTETNYKKNWDNEIMWRNYDTSSIATNWCWYIPSTGQIIETDIVFNDFNYSWSTSGSAGQMDVQNIATHELGHSLCLSDLYGSADSEKTMYGFGILGETKKRTLHNNDREGIQWIYPGQENNPPQLSSPLVQPMDGTPSTDFYYYVNYNDGDGDSPSLRQVHVDGTPYAMSLHSGMVSNGVYRYGPKNLSASSHNYNFYFEDGKGAYAKLPASGSYSGPTVSQENNPPNVPSNTSPANHATGISTDADLSWIGGDPDAGDTVSYDIYFGASAIPPLVSNDQLAATYDPGILNNNTKYYWRVVATDNHGAFTASPLWDFTTGLTPNSPPNMPSNTSPANHATGISTDADLSWIGGDPDVGDTVTYDVYFGIGPTPPLLTLVSNEQVGTTYEPGTLSYNTTYCWKIISSDNQGAFTEGPLWNFTTGLGSNNPPNMPSNPSPLNHAAGVSIDADLSWTGGDPDAGDMVSYDVYFGTTAIPHLISNGQLAATYDPGTLDSNTKYYWRIVAADSHSESAIGPLWGFTTGSTLNNSPNLPAAPSPANHATGISIDADLNWIGGDPDAGDTVTYDVYFGIGPTPPLLTLVSNEQVGTTYELGTLSYNTTYYWKIISSDNQGAFTEGPLWNFTMGSEPEPETTWGFPYGTTVFLCPTAANNRPYLGTAVSLPTGTEPAELQGVYWLDEATEEWKYFNPRFTLNTLNSLEQGEAYLVAVSGSCVWDLPCAEGSASPMGNVWSFNYGPGAFLAPASANNRLYLNAAVTLPTGAEPVELLGVYWLDEATGEWKYFNPNFTVNTLSSLEPDQAYLVVVSGACSWHLS